MNANFGHTTGFTSGYGIATWDSDGLMLDGNDAGAGYYALIGPDYTNKNANEANSNFADVSLPTGISNYMAVNGSPSKSLSFWSEDVTLVAGDTYDFSFLSTGLLPTSNAAPDLQMVFPDGTKQDFSIPPAYDQQRLNSDNGWRLNSYEFVVPTGSTTTYTLSFTDRSGASDGNDFGITGLTLVDVTAPAPSGITLMSLGLACLAPFAWRRRKLPRAFA